METKQFAVKHQGLLIFGIILLLIGLVASFYAQVEIGTYIFSGETYEISRTYPYQGIGMVLVLAGIIFVAMGFFYSPKKRET